MDIGNVMAVCLCYGVFNRAVRCSECVALEAVAISVKCTGREAVGMILA